MTFFYDLNKKLDSIRDKPETTHKQLNENLAAAPTGYQEPTSRYDYRQAEKKVETPAYQRKALGAKPLKLGDVTYGKDKNVKEGYNLGDLEQGKYYLHSIYNDSKIFSDPQSGDPMSFDNYDKAENVLNRLSGREVDEYQVSVFNQGKLLPADQDMAEGAMPTSVIKAKESIRMASDEENKKRFAGKTQAELAQMARRHGYKDKNPYAKFHDGITESTQAVAEGSGDPQIPLGMKTQYGTVVSVDDDKVTVRASNGDLMTMNIQDVKQGVAEGAQRMSRAAKGIEKYTKSGMEELSRLGREGASEKKMDAARKKYNQYDDNVEEGLVGDAVSAAKSGFGKIGNMIKGGAKRTLDVVAPGDEELLRGLQKSVGVPQTGKKPGAIGSRHEGYPRMSGGGQVPAMPKSKEGYPRFSGGGGYTGKGVAEEGSAAMTPKQKSFAKLAPPADKITFADKIAGAKKEVDEMLGDVAAEAMKSALGGGRSRGQGMDEASDDNAFTAHKRPRTDTPKVGTIERGAKHDIEHTATGRKVTRRVDPQGMSVGTDDEPAAGEKRGPGRPKRTDGPAQERVTAKSRKADRTTYQGKKKATEGADDPAEKGEYDREGDMALDDIDTIQSAAQELQSIIDADENLPEWVQSKINKAMDYLDTARDYMAAQGNDNEEQVTEKAVSKKQQRFMGMVHAAQKSKKPASKAVATVAKEMPEKEAEKFASTKHKGLPEKKKSDDAPKKKKEKTEEAGGTGTPTASSGFSYGKGIYDSFDRDLENMIKENMQELRESMSINMSMNTDAHGGPSKSLTVTATDDDALKLGQLLKMAGLGNGSVSPYGDQEMDEAYGDTNATPNSPDYPTNTETSADALQYSGGLNKPKSTGQSTVPVLASQEERQESYAAEEEDAIRRMMEMAGVKKKAVDEEKTEEGNKFTGNLAKARADGKKEADLDGDGDMEKVRESIFDLTSQWKAYKG